MGEAIQKLSPKHIEILNYLIANPVVRMGEVAVAFGMTAGWLSQVIHSDAFQRMLAERQDIVFHHSILPLKEKMTAIAHRALDRLDERIDSETDLDTLTDTAATVLDRIGFSPKGTPVVQNTVVNNLIMIERENLKKARALIGNRTPSAMLQGPQHALQANQELILGESSRQAALSAPSPADACAEAGSEI